MISAFVFSAYYRTNGLSCRHFISAMIKNDSLAMDLEFGQDSSIDPILSQEDGLNMSELGGNPNHDDSRDSILSDPQLKVD